MLKLYFVLVVIYFLFGYFFLPDSICSTGWYFLSAALFPVAFFIVIGLLAQKGIIKNSSQQIGRASCRERVSASV